MGKKKGGKAPPVLSVIEVLVKDPGVRLTNHYVIEGVRASQPGHVCLSPSSALGESAYIGLQLQALARSLAACMVPWLWREAQHRSLVCYSPEPRFSESTRVAISGLILSSRAHP